MAVITEYEIRQRLKTEPMTEVIVEPNTIVTPSAKSFLNERGIGLVIKGQAEPGDFNEKLQREPLPQIELTERAQLWQVKWQLFRVTLIKIQQKASLAKSVSLVSDLMPVVEVIAQIIETFNTNVMIDEKLLKPVSSGQPQLDLTYNMSAIALDLAELTLTAKEMAIGLGQCYSDDFGHNTRPDISKSCHWVATYLGQLVSKN